MPSPSVALLVEWLLALKHPVAESAGMAGEGDPRLDWAHAAPAQLAVALFEGLAVPREALVGDSHQRVAALTGGLAGDPPRLADRRRLLSRRGQASEGVKVLGGGKALDRLGMGGECRGPSCRGTRRLSSATHGRCSEPVASIAITVSGEHRTPERLLAFACW
jgi:hypothetical protein